MSSKSRVCRAVAGPAQRPHLGVHPDALRPRARPGQLFGAHPAVGAVQPADLIGQPQPASAQVEVSPAAPPPVIDRRGQHAARAAQQPGPRTQGDFDVAVADDDIGHPRPRDLQQTVKCSTDAHAVPPVAVGVVTPKPRATPRERPSFHPRNADTVAPPPKPPPTSTKAPTKTRGAPHMFERAHRHLPAPTQPRTVSHQAKSSRRTRSLPPARLPDRPG